METSKHFALMWPYGKEMERRWSSWDKMDEKKKWLKKVKDGKEEYAVDLVESLFSNLDVY